MVTSLLSLLNKSKEETSVPMVTAVIQVLGPGREGIQGAKWLCKSSFSPLQARTTS